MSRLSYLSRRVILPAVGVLAAFGISKALAEIQSGELRVKSVQGVVTYSTNQSTWLEVKPNMTLPRGAVLRTGPGSSADVIFEYSGTVLHMTPDSLLELAKLDKEIAGENILIETSLNLNSGSIVGSQRKLAKPSKFEIAVPGVVVTIRGTEYAVRADGTVTCFSGAVSINYNSPQRVGSVQAEVPEGFTFDPASRQVRATTSDCLRNFAGDVHTVRENAKACCGGSGEHCEEPRCPISPTHGHGHRHGHGHDDGHDDHRG